MLSAGGLGVLGIFACVVLFYIIFRKHMPRD